MERKDKLEEEIKEQIKTMRNSKKNLPQGSMENYAAQVKAKLVEFEGPTGALSKAELDQAEELMRISGEIDPNARQAGQSKRAYHKELKKVIELADVVIEVLDARDPEGCRSKEIEEMTLQANKKVMLVLNKIDLVPPQNARMW